uniref:DnaJ domain-containing protein n=1 Tax=Ndongobacter massiliensis TaxID=1871025 RepID=UPI00093054FE|nr:DnaJ domain-containing protein [Ndongobacter massiliensis]
MKRLWGSFLYGLARLLDAVFGALMGALSYVVDLVDQVRAFLMPLVGCFVMFVIMNPLSLLFFRSPLIGVVLLIMIFPLLGRKFVSFLEYGNYILCEYLYDKAEQFRGGAKAQNFQSYGAAYRRKKQQEEEEARRRRQQQQQEEWNRIFEEWFGRGGAGGAQQGPFGGAYYGSAGGYRPGGVGTADPTVAFNEKYQKSCRVLGLSTETDAYQVKLAYRKLAKKYHPDINKSPEATQKFQEINEAYEFLSEENIQRYKRINR